MNSSSVSDKFTPRIAWQKFLPLSCHGHQWVLVPVEKQKEGRRFIRQSSCLGSEEGRDWWPVLQFWTQFW